MKIYTTTKFTGHWPVGVAAVVVAPNKAAAVDVLEFRLKEHGLPQKVREEDLDELNVRLPDAHILRDGEY